MTKQTPKPKTVTFENCKTLGDMHQALTNKFTNYSGGTYVLEEALRKVRENDKKIEEYTKQLLTQQED